MTAAVTHFEIYRELFDWTIDKAPGIDYFQIQTGPPGNGSAPPSFPAVELIVMPLPAAGDRGSGLVRAPGLVRAALARRSARTLPAWPSPTR